MSWYKVDNTGLLLSGDRISGPGFNLTLSSTEGVDGWEWFDSDEEAAASLGATMVGEKQVDPKIIKSIIRLKEVEERISTISDAPGPIPNSLISQSLKLLANSFIELSTDFRKLALAYGRDQND